MGRKWICRTASITIKNFLLVVEDLISWRGKKSVIYAVVYRTLTASLGQSWPDYDYVSLMTTRWSSKMIRLTMQSSNCHKLPSRWLNWWSILKYVNIKTSQIYIFPKEKMEMYKNFILIVLIFRTFINFYHFANNNQFER